MQLLTRASMCAFTKTKIGPEGIKEKPEVLSYYCLGSAVQVQDNVIFATTSKIVAS